MNECELVGFALRMMAERMRFRLDAMEEAALSGVSISKTLARDIVNACQRGSELLENPEPARAGLSANSGNGAANVSEDVTPGESAGGNVAGEIGGHRSCRSIDDPATRVHAEFLA